MTTIAEMLEEATPDRREVEVCLDRRLISELVSLRAMIERIENDNEGMLGKKAQVPEGYTKRLEEIEGRVREKTRTFAFEGLGWGAWRELLSQHPPKDDQAEIFQRAVKLLFMPHAIENLTYNAESFVPAAIAASCVEPGMAEAEARRLLDKAPPGVVEKLWTAVLEVNLAGGSDPFVAPVLQTASAGARRTTKK